MKKRKINKKTFSWQGITYRIFVICINALFFKIGAKQAMIKFGALGASLIWNSINMALYFFYHGIFLKLFSLEMQTKGSIIWFTGLSGSGKTTITNQLQKELIKIGKTTQILDGDILRKTVSKDLGFSLEDRKHNLERANEIANMLSKNNVIVLCSFISPIRQVRNKFKFNAQNFIEVYVKASLKTCEQRDVKGLYVKARKGEIKDFTGISQKYEKPLNPGIILDTEKETIKQSTQKVINYLKEKDLI